MNNDSAFAAKYVAQPVGRISIAPKAVAIPSGIKVISNRRSVFKSTVLKNWAALPLCRGLGLTQSEFSNNTVWVDEKNPPIKISYDTVNQRFQFGVNHTAIGPGTDSNFRAFKIYGAANADGTNNLGIPAPDAATSVSISSTAIISGEPFVADGAELQINAKRFGVSVEYNSDVKTFTFASGTTGEAIGLTKLLALTMFKKPLTSKLVVLR